jgi:hypothetical protein
VNSSCHCLAYNCGSTSGRPAKRNGSRRTLHFQFCFRDVQSSPQTPTTGYEGDGHRHKPLILLWFMAGDDGAQARDLCRDRSTRLLESESYGKRKGALGALGSASSFRKCLGVPLSVSVQGVKQRSINRSRWAGTCDSDHGASMPLRIPSRSSLNLRIGRQYGHHSTQARLSSLILLGY